MLELKGITKIYKPEKSAPVTALNKVDLSFGDRGMVFVLGKSGSGKSTLLNVIDGLDGADGGEIVIDGKSSASFCAGDYDAYRNTYIGFIFQEYNLLDEFTVAENISLALELQGKEADGDKISKILEQVDLEGYGDRRPRQLSGGQRQRVAIARALIKDPKIIMADEPTGALDSQTGRAVLEALKKASRERLVIVVSHDREFAEEYGDRIIELSDGKVIGDRDVNAERAEEGVLSVEQTRGETKSEMLRSRLPYRRAFKIGARSMGCKPIRLIVTLILCIITFSAFAFVTCGYSFDKVEIATQVFYDGGYDGLAFLTSEARTGSYMWHDYIVGGNYRGSSQRDLDKLREESGVDFLGVVGNGQWLSLVDRENEAITDKIYHNYYVDGCLPADPALFAKLGFEVIGRIPESSDEVMITKYQYDAIEKYGLTYYYDKKHYEIYPSDIQDFLSKVPRVSVDDIYRKIVGVLDANADQNGRYSSLKDVEEKSRYDHSYIERECYSHFRYGYNNVYYLSVEEYKAAVERENYWANNPMGKGAHGLISIDRNDSIYRFGNNDFDIIAPDSSLDKMDGIVWAGGKKRETLADNELVVGWNTFEYLHNSEFDSFDELCYVEYEDRFLDGKVSIKKIRFKDFRWNVPRLIAYLEEADSIGEEELEKFKDYCIDIDYIFRPRKTPWKYADISIDMDSIDSFDSMEDIHWRLSYAVYLNEANIDLEEYGHRQGKRRIKGGFNENVTGRAPGIDFPTEKGYKYYKESKMQWALDLNAWKVMDDSLRYYTSNFYNPHDRYLPKDCKIVGVYYIESPEYENRLEFDRRTDKYIFNNFMYEDMNDESIIYSYLIAPMPSTREEIRSLVELSFFSVGRTAKIIDYPFEFVDILDKDLELCVMYMIMACSLLALFSALLFGNYISISIADRKREIGILRSLGAKSADVFKIFVTECVWLAVMVFVLSSIVTPLVCLAVNSFIESTINLNIKVINFGIVQISLIFAITVGVAIISSVIPLLAAVRKKPIDCIRGK